MSETPQAVHFFALNPQRVVTAYIEWAVVNITRSSVTVLTRAPRCMILIILNQKWKGEYSAKLRRILIFQYWYKGLKKQKDKEDLN